MKGSQRHNNIIKYKCTVSTTLKWLPFLMMISLCWEIQQWNITGGCRQPSFKGIHSRSHAKALPEQSQQCNCQPSHEKWVFKKLWTLGITYNIGSLAHELTTCQKQMTTVGPFHPVVQYHPKWFSPKLHMKRNMV